jgi:signal peptidase I
VRPGLRKLVWRTAVAVSFVIVLLFVALIGAFGSGYFKHFYLPSEAMAPTLEKGDRLVAYMNGGGDLRRGDIVLVAVGKATYVKRVAALAGDTIGMSDGIVHLNGRAVPQRLLGEERRVDWNGPHLARRLAERFPGEAAEHWILDFGPTDVDEMPERRIPPGFLFVLGDNRDHSADSRVPREQDGVDLLPIQDVRGRALFYTWPRAKMGRKLGH